MSDSAYKSYLLWILTLLLMFNLLDRVALDILMQEIKIDLALSDTQLGLLTGIAFALFYSLMGLPIARWADTGDRVKLMSATTGLWCAAVAACSIAANFWQLLLIRGGVAVGEAGCMPPAHSLIADHFTREERPRAVARYLMGAPLSGLIGYFLAGWLNEFVGWRITFLILGLPGLLLAVVVLFTLREPRRAALLARKTDAEAPRAGLREAVAKLWAIPTFRHLLLCYSVVCFFGAGKAKWQAVFFIRSYGLSTGELGTWFAIIFGFGGLLGTYLGGEMASRTSRFDERKQLRLIAIAYGLCGLSASFAYIVPSLYGAIALIAISTLILTSTYPTLFATVQLIVPNDIRATAIAVLLTCSSLIGLGLGPVAAGYLSDLLRPAYGNESLRWSLIAMCPGFLWATLHCWRASTLVLKDLPTAKPVAARTE